MPTLTGESFPSSARERVLNSPGMILSSVPVGPGEDGPVSAVSEPLPEMDLSALATSETHEPEIESIDTAPVEEIVRTAPGFRNAGRDSQTVQSAREDFGGDVLNPSVSSENLGVPKYRSILVPDVKTGEVTDPSRATFPLVPRVEDAADGDAPR